MPVSASGDPEKDAWTLMRVCGNGEVLIGDEIYFEAEAGERLSVLGDAGDATVVALENSTTAWKANSRFMVEVKSLSEPPARVGFATSLAGGLEGVEWYGRGPHESYCDRWDSAKVGVFSGAVLDQSFKYCRPQENGNKFETRWMALKGQGWAGECGGLLVVAEALDGSGTQVDADVPTLEMQCHQYPLEQFDGPEKKEKQLVRHGGELSPCKETTLCVDAFQMGVGGVDSWGAKPLRQHRLGLGATLQWSFRLRPLKAKDLEGGSDAIAAIARRCRAAARL